MWWSYLPEDCFNFKILTNLNRGHGGQFRFWPHSSFWTSKKGSVRLGKDIPPPIHLKLGRKKNIQKISPEKKLWLVWILAPDRRPLRNPTPNSHTGWIAKYKIEDHTWQFLIIKKSQHKLDNSIRFKRYFRSPEVSTSMKISRISF